VSGRNRQTRLLLACHLFKLSICGTPIHCYCRSGVVEFDSSRADKAIQFFLDPVLLTAFGRILQLQI